MAVLSPLPNNRYIGVSEEFRKGCSDCLISVDGNRYSVPHIFACRDIWIRISQGRYLEVYSQSNKLMAKHTLEKTEKGKFSKGIFTQSLTLAHEAVQNHDHINNQYQ
jgi:hypothetical protein